MPKTSKFATSEMDADKERSDTDQEFKDEDIKRSDAIPVGIMSTGLPAVHPVPACVSVEIRNVSGTSDFAFMKTTGTGIVFLNDRIVLTAAHVQYKGQFRGAGIIFNRHEAANPAQKFIELEDGDMPAHPSLDLRMLVLKKAANVPVLTPEDLPAVPVNLVMQGFGGPNNAARVLRELPITAYMNQPPHHIFAARAAAANRAYSGDSGSPALPVPAGSPPTRAYGLLSVELSNGVERLVFTHLNHEVKTWVKAQAELFGIVIT